MKMAGVSVCRLCANSAITVAKVRRSPTLHHKTIKHLRAVNDNSLNARYACVVWQKRV